MHVAVKPESPHSSALNIQAVRSKFWVSSLTIMIAKNGCPRRGVVDYPTHRSYKNEYVKTAEFLWKLHDFEPESWTQEAIVNVEETQIKASFITGTARIAEAANRASKNGDAMIGCQLAGSSIQPAYAAKKTLWKVSLSKIRSVGN